MRSPYLLCCTPWLALWLCLSTNAHAEQALTWQQCAAEAAAHNPDLQAAQAQFQASSFQRQSAASGLYPQVSASAGYTYSGGDKPLQNGSVYSAGVGVTQNIFAGYLDQSKITQATANEAAAAATLALAKAKLGYDLKFAFQGLIYAQGYQRLAQDILHRREENLRLVELRFDSGRENKGSVLLSRAYLAQAQLDALQARNARDVAQTQLVRVLGRAGDDELTIKDSLPINEPEAQPDFNALVLRTPEYQQSVAQEQAAHATVGIARAPTYPNINLSSQLNRQGDELAVPDTRWSVGLSLSYPLYNGGKDVHNLQSAGALATAARDARTATQMQLRVRLKQAYVGLVESQQRLKTDLAFYDAATTRAQIAREKYNNGLLTFDEWDIIENDLVNREKNRLQSQRDRVVAEAAWDQALGRGVIP
ncbi:MAG: TolC family protein [Gammaproteobacteria bacterium]|nr:TolC family protein [Gammaproteobacteria bacterium]